MLGEIFIIGVNGAISNGTIDRSNRNVLFLVNCPVVGQLFCHGGVSVGSIQGCKRIVSYYIKLHPIEYIVVTIATLID